MKGWWTSFDIELIRFWGFDAADMDEKICLSLESEI